MTVPFRHSRVSFGQAVRRARRAGTLRRYDKHALGYWRRAELSTGEVLVWAHPSLGIESTQ